MKTLATNACRVAIKSEFCQAVVKLQPERYHNGQIAIIAYMDNGERAFVATVNMPLPPRGNCVWVKGWSENKGIPEQLVEHKLIQLTGRTAKTGFTVAQEAKLLDITGREVTEEAPIDNENDDAPEDKPDAPGPTNDSTGGDQSSASDKRQPAAGKPKKKGK